MLPAFVDEPEAAGDSPGVAGEPTVIPVEADAEKPDVTMMGTLPGDAAAVPFPVLADLVDRRVTACYDGRWLDGIITSSSYSWLYIILDLDKDKPYATSRFHASMVRLVDDSERPLAAPVDAQIRAAHELLVSQETDAEMMTDGISTRPRDDAVQKEHDMNVSAPLREEEPTPMEADASSPEAGLPSGQAGEGVEGEAVPTIKGYNTLVDRILNLSGRDAHRAQRWVTCQDCSLALPDMAGTLISGSGAVYPMSCPN